MAWCVDGRVAGWRGCKTNTARVETPDLAVGILFGNPSDKQRRRSATTIKTSPYNNDAA